MGSSAKMDSITYMEPVLFKAAAEGNIDSFENYQTCLDQLLNQNENTILHVYLRNQRSEPEFTDFVDLILEMCPPLLLQANKNGETPFHLAARYGHSNVVKVLIDRAKSLPTDPESGVTEAKKMLRMPNGERDTALHEAARNSRIHVVEILTEEDPEFSYSANVHGETPLYISVSFGWLNIPEREKVIDEILRNCISVDYGGPNGRTALHAASTVRDDVTARKLLEKEEFHKNNRSERVVTTSLRCLFLFLVDNRGWNALYYAVASKRTTAFKKCLEIPELDRIETEKDDKGNTPFHLIAALVLKQDGWKSFYYGGESRGIYGLNKQKLSIKDIYSENFDEIKESHPLASIGCCLFPRFGGSILL